MNSSKNPSFSEEEEGKPHEGLPTPNPTFLHLNTRKNNKSNKKE